jgi:hypothetical protein
MTCPEAMPDGTREGDGEWQGGRWNPDIGSGNEPAADPMWRTHHEAGSAEESYSRQMRFDKYRAMQQLLNEIGFGPPPEDVRPFWDQMRQKAQAILAGMVRPRGPAARAEERAVQLEALARAYRMAAETISILNGSDDRAAALTIEALKAWERAHPPAPLDPLLGP